MKETAPLESARTAVDLLRSPTPDVESMKAADLLIAIRRVGKVKRNKILTQARVSPSKTLGGLTSRQREELALALISYHPTRRELAHA